MALSDAYKDKTVERGTPFGLIGAASSFQRLM